MRKGVLIIFVIIAWFNSTAQQLQLSTNYILNNYAYNPAIAGSKSHSVVNLNYRNQWTGFDGAPKTYVLSVNSRLLKGKMGVGAFMFNDEIGPFKTLNASLNAAYHLKFPDSEFSLGIQGNYLKQRFEIENNMMFDVVIRARFDTCYPHNTKFEHFIDFLIDLLRN